MHCDQRLSFSRMAQQKPYHGSHACQLLVWLSKSLFMDHACQLLEWLSKSLFMDYARRLLEWLTSAKAFSWIMLVSF